MFMLLQVGMLGVFCRWTSSFSTSSGKDAGADVLPHRRVGRAAQQYAAIKFFLYTLVGIGADAAGHPGPLFPIPRDRVLYMFDLVS